MRKFLSFLMVSLMAVSLSAKTIYLNTGGANLWNQADAVFFTHSWGDGDSDQLMTLVEGDVFSAEVPDTHTSIVFVRMAPGSEAIDWSSKWNQTQDMIIEADKNLCNITDWNTGAWAVYTPAEQGGDAEQMYVWNGIGVTKAEDATELGGAAEAVQADGTNIVVGASQKGNWCLKANKGFSSGKYYLGIAMNNGVNAGDTIKIAYFRTTASSTYVMGMDFSADKASAATTYQILAQGDPQVLASNGTPVDSIYIVPEGVANAKYMRIYRNSGSTGLWIAKVEIVKANAGDTPEPPTPVVTKDLALVPGVWATDAAVLGVWSWGEGAEGAWSAFAGEGDTLIAKINENADSVIFVRFEAGAALDWNSTIWNRTENEAIDECGLFLVNDWDNYSWCAAPAPVVEPKFYLTGDSALLADAGAQGKVWNPDAIASMEDTLVLNLNADQRYMLKITKKGNWDEGVLGYDELTGEIPAGISRGEGEDGNNIIFKLSEAGIVNVIYIAGESPIFRVESEHFYVEPAPVIVTKDLALVPGVWATDAAVLGVWSWGEGAEGAWSAFAGEGDTLIAKINENADSVIFVRFEAGAALDWNSTIWNRTENEAIDECGLFLVNDWDNYSWCAAPAPVVPVLANGYYLVGDFAGVATWTPAAERLFVQNPDNEAEYVLTSVTLVADDSLKVVYVENDDILTWYPIDAPNYVVDADHAGVKNIYFRADGQGGNDWYYATIYIAPNTPTACENVAADAKAVKVLRNGMLVIESNGKQYNVLGEVIR